MAEYFEIAGLGGKQALEGVISVGGAKNAALQALSMSILFDDGLRIENAPDIEDVARMAELLSAVGVSVDRSGDPHTARLHAGKLDGNMPERETKRLRASIVASGPLLARTGRVSFPHPGGCVIGTRAIDLFVEGFRKMGARFTGSEGAYQFETDGLVGAEIFLRVPSVTATQTLMFAATHARGETVIKNAALEPETAHLAEFLNACGADIKGAGTQTIRITGTGSLTSAGRAYVVPPDRIEAGSFVILAALAGRDVTVTGCVPEHNEALLELIDYTCSSEITVGDSEIRVRNTKPLSICPVNVKTNEYPGFSTDLQAPFTVLLTQARGESLVFETIFEGRLAYTESLNAMGGDITMMDPHRVLVRGPSALAGKRLESPDIRAGLAYAIAAVVAKGRSVIHNVYYIDRGYERVEERLRGVGVDISRRTA